MSIKNNVAVCKVCQKMNVDDRDILIFTVRGTDNTGHTGRVVTKFNYLCRSCAPSFSNEEI